MYVCTWCSFQLSFSEDLSGILLKRCHAVRHKLTWVIEVINQRDTCLSSFFPAFVRCTYWVSCLLSLKHFSQVNRVGNSVVRGRPGKEKYWLQPLKPRSAPGELSGVQLVRNGVTCSPSPQQEHTCAERSGRDRKRFDGKAKAACRTVGVPAARLQILRRSEVAPCLSHC